MLNSPEIHGFICYMASCYAKGHPAIYNELVSAGYGGAWRTSLKYGDRVTIALIRKGVRWAVKGYYASLWRYKKDENSLILIDQLPYTIQDNEIDMVIDIKLFLDKHAGRDRHLLLLFLGGYSYREISQILKISHERVRQLLERSLKCSQ